MSFCFISMIRILLALLESQSPTYRDEVIASIQELVHAHNIQEISEVIGRNVLSGSEEEVFHLLLFAFGSMPVRSTHADFVVRIVSTFQDSNDFD